MKHNHLSINAKESNWRLYMTRKSDPAFTPFCKKVFQRDSYTCQYCGFCAGDEMDVVNLDQNYLNNKMSNCVTCCPLCSQCCFIDAIGKSDFGGGVLIYLPELSQEQLNALCHVIFFNIALGTSSVSSSKDIYRSLKMRSQQFEHVVGKGLSNPSIYGQVLIESNHEEKDRIHAEITSKVRLLPNFKRFGSFVLSCAQNSVHSLFHL